MIFRNYHNQHIVILLFYSFTDWNENEMAQYAFRRMLSAPCNGITIIRYY